MANYPRQVCCMFCNQKPCLEYPLGRSITGRNKTLFDCPRCGCWWIWAWIDEQPDKWIICEEGKGPFRIGAKRADGYHSVICIRVKARTASSSALRQSSEAQEQRSEPSDSTSH